jgi:hypothetical protein
VRIFIGTTHLKVDFVAAQAPTDASFWVVDASAYRVPGTLLHVAPTSRAGDASVMPPVPPPMSPPRVHTGGAQTPGGLTLGLSALTALAVAKWLGASWGLAAGAAIGAPLVLLGAAVLLTQSQRPPTQGFGFAVTPMISPGRT